MIPTLVIGVCLALASIAIYVRHAIDGAYFKGRYDELTEAESWNRLQIELAYQRGANEAIYYMQKTMPDTMNQAYRQGWSNAVTRNLCHTN